MIIGRGDIAKAINDREGFIFYCNGVSNRLPLTANSTMKEMEEVVNCDRNGMFVYVSTLSIYYSESKYTEHKKTMEYLVKTSFKNHCILRIGNITWGDNPNTLCNYLKRKPSAERKDVFRYLIDKKEFNHWIGMIPKSGEHEMNITGKMVNVQQHFGINDLGSTYLV